MCVYSGRIRIRVGTYYNIGTYTAAFVTNKKVDVINRLDRLITLYLLRMSLYIMYVYECAVYLQVHIIYISLVRTRATVDCAAGYL